MATTVVLTDVVLHPEGHVEVRWADNTGETFANIEAMRQHISQYDSDVDLTKALCMAFLMARSSDLTNTSPVRNRNFTFDLTHNSPIRVQ